MNVMRTTVATVVAATLSMSAFSAFAAASLTGAGATFPAPVYAKWADTYQKETGNKVNYRVLVPLVALSGLLPTPLISVLLMLRWLMTN